MFTGKSIAHYEVGEKLGRGGMGVVYKAIDTKLDRTVALKFLSRQLSENEDAKQRFIREAKSASALDHANICTVHDIAETPDGELYIVMAYYEGQTLRQAMDAEAFSIDRATTVVRQIGMALERAHEADIIHRDIKPANIILSRKDEVKLLDFGLAKLTTGIDLTVEGSTVGTIAYMSPEQSRGDALTPATDVWSLGVVAYELITGEKPFGGAYDQAVIYGILNETPLPVKEVRPDVPEKLASTIDRALEKDPAKRFVNAGEFIAELDGATITSPPVSTESSFASSPGAAPASPARKLQPKYILVGLIAGLALVAIGKFFSVSDSTNNDVVLSEERMAVIPFRIRGSEEVQYLGEGIVDLLSQKLDGAGVFQSIDPRAVIALIKDRRLDVADPETGSIVARALGAGRYLTGSVVESGSRLDISASLHDTETPTVAVESASKVGPTENLFELLDGLAADLLTGSLSGPEARLQKLATLTTESLPAVKAFLRGEKLLRGGEYREAAAAYDEAVAIDSTFVLAYYKKSLAGDWIDAPDRTTTADRALALSGKLSPRDRSIIEALRDQRVGLRRKALQEYTNHLNQYPDDVEPQTQLAELYFHDNPRRGEPLSESRPPFERALQLERGNLIARIHLARIDALEGNLGLLKEHADYFNAESPNSERTVEVNALYAFATDSLELQQLVLEELREGPWFYYAYVVLGVGKNGRNPVAAERILETRTTDAAPLVQFSPVFSVMNGKHRAAQEFALDDSDRGSGSWDLFNSFVLTSGTIDASNEDLNLVLDRVRDADWQDILASSFLPPHDSYTRELILFERGWTEARALIALDRHSEARRIIDGLKNGAKFYGLGSFADDSIAGLEGELLHAEGKTTEAIRALRSMEYDIPHWITWRPFGDLSPARFLLAELELEVGNATRAEELYTGFLESWSPFDAFYTPMIYDRLGQIAEDDGRVDLAIFYYSHFVHNWQNCDSELVPKREAIQRRLDALLLRKAREA